LQQILVSQKLLLVRLFYLLGIALEIWLDQGDFSMNSANILSLLS